MFPGCKGSKFFGICVVEKGLIRMNKEELRF